MAFGGWDVVFQSGVNQGYVGLWSCGFGCPPTIGSGQYAYFLYVLSMFPFAGIFWTVVGLLSLADLA